HDGGGYAASRGRTCSRNRTIERSHAACGRHSCAITRTVPNPPTSSRSLASLAATVSGSPTIQMLSRRYSSVALIAVDPAVQQRGIGRRLMEAALERTRGAAGVRLVQEAYNTLAMSLYASLGFEVKEPLLRMTGRPRSAPRPGVEVRAFGPDRLEECARLCARVHGVDRSGDLRDAFGVFSPFA